MSKKKQYLIAIIISLILNLLFSVIEQQGVKLSLKEFLGTIPIIVGILGAIYEGRPTTDTELSKKLKIDLSENFRSGILGGLIGGFCSGVFVLIAYRTSAVDPDWLTTLRILPYLSICGCLFGGLIQAMTALFKLVHFNGKWSSFSGAILGCTVAGTVTGILGMWLFGDNGEVFFGATNIIIASVISALALVAGCLLYDYKGKFIYFIYSLLLAIVVTVTVGSGIYLLILKNDMFETFIQKTYSESMQEMLEAGAIIGSINGFVFGTVIGVTIIFFRIIQSSSR